jgi:hypothetical protein
MPINTIQSSHAPDDTQPRSHAQRGNEVDTCHM